MQNVFLIPTRGLVGHPDEPSSHESAQARREDDLRELGYALNVTAKTLKMDDDRSTSQVWFLSENEHDALQTSYALVPYAPKLKAFETYERWQSGESLMKDHVLGHNGTLAMVGSPIMLEGVAQALYNRYFLAGKDVSQKKAVQFFLQDAVADYLFNIPGKTYAQLQHRDVLFSRSFKPEYLALQRGQEEYKRYKELQGAFAVRQLEEFKKVVLGLPSNK